MGLDSLPVAFGVDTAKHTSVWAILPHTPHTPLAPPLLRTLTCRAMGLDSLPVAFGVDTAKYICVGSIDATQLGVAAYLALGLHQTTYAAVLLGLVLPQIFFQFKYFLPDPIANDVKYQVGHGRARGGRWGRAPGCCCCCPTPQVPPPSAPLEH